MVNCPYCETELTCEDYYGTGIPMTTGFEKIGDICSCNNEECDMFNENFYTDEQDELHEGYPC